MFLAMVCSDELLYIIVLAFQNKLLFSLNPNFLGVVLTRTKTSIVYLFLMFLVIFFIKVRVYIEY